MENSAKNDDLLMEAEEAFEKQVEESLNSPGEEKIELVKSEEEIQEAIAEVDQEESEVAQKPTSYGVSELRMKVRSMIKKMIEEEFEKMIKKLGLEE